MENIKRLTNAMWVLFKFDLIWWVTSTTVGSKKSGILTIKAVSWIIAIHFKALFFLSEWTLLLWYSTGCLMASYRCFAMITVMKIDEVKNIGLISNKKNVKMYKNTGCKLFWKKNVIVFGWHLVQRTKSFRNNIETIITEW